MYEYPGLHKLHACYARAHNMHANGVTRARIFVHGVDWEHHWELLRTYFKKIRTTTTTVHSVFNSQHSCPKSLQRYYSIWSSIFRTLTLSLIDLSQADIQILYGFQIDNGIWQCVNSSWTGIF